MSGTSRIGPRAALLVCIGTCATFASLTQAQATQDFSKVEIKPGKIAANLYVIDESEVHGGSISVFTGPDGVLMVDTGVVPLAPKVAAAIKRLSSQPIRYVINTHAHVDETDGNEYFGRLGATIIAREQVRYSMLRPRTPLAGIPLPGRQARQARPPAPDTALPKLTYAYDMSLHFNGQDIRLIAVPRAHEFPSIGRPDGGTLPGMLEGLATLIGLAGPQTRIVTSHGAVVDRSVAIAQRDFLLTSRDRIAALLAQGKSVDEVIAANVTADLGVRALPGHIGADAFIRDVYGELQAGR